MDGEEAILEFLLKKARYWEAHGNDPLNERQKAVLNRLLDGYEGKLTLSKWAALTRCSQDTALRDIDDLVKRGFLTKDSAGGRSMARKPWVACLSSSPRERSARDRESRCR